MNFQAPLQIEPMQEFYSDVFYKSKQYVYFNISFDSIEANATIFMTK